MKRINKNLKEPTLTTRKKLLEISINEVEKMGITTSRYLDFLKDELFIVEEEITKENQRIEEIKNKNEVQRWK